ncbi:hypothetical protein L7F22_002448 [Adiantum nelumboides]|nr:hypothetical protein [Adiantum nelumboides]
MFSSPSSSAVPLFTPFKPKAAHTPEPLWKYVAENASFAKGGSKKWSCSFCKLHFAGSYPHVRAHLLGIKNQRIQVCCKVSAEERASLTKEDHESAAKKQKSSSDSFNKKRATQPSVAGMFKNASGEEVDEAFARCFYACGLPFVLARSPYFQDMVSAIASFGKGYKASNYEKIRTTLLDKEKAKICGQLTGTESSWEQLGSVSTHFLDAMCHSLLESFTEGLGSYRMDGQSY